MLRKPLFFLLVLSLPLSAFSQNLDEILNPKKDPYGIGGEIRPGNGDIIIGGGGGINPNILKDYPGKDFPSSGSSGLGTLGPRGNGNISGPLGSIGGTINPNGISCQAKGKTPIGDINAGIKDPFNGPPVFNVGGGHAFGDIGNTSLISDSDGNTDIKIGSGPAFGNNKISIGIHDDDNGISANGKGSFPIVLPGLPGSGGTNGVVTGTGSIGSNGASAGIGVTTGPCFNCGIQCNKQNGEKPTGDVHIGIDLGF